MPNEYFDSTLTGAEIEQALTAVHGLISPSNNGKVLCVENGTLTAKSAADLSDITLEPLSVTANGDYTPSGSVDGYSSVHVAVSGSVLTTKSITQNGTYNASQDDADGYSSVVVNVSGGGGGAVVQPLSVTQNGTYTPPSGVDGYAPVTVNVSGGGGGLTKIMTQGQVSTTSNYATAYFDSGIDPSSYDFIMVDLFKGGSMIGTSAVPINQALPITFYIYGDITYTMLLSADSISCTRYSGSYYNLYVDVYGLNR